MQLYIPQKPGLRLRRLPGHSPCATSWARQSRLRQFALALPRELPCGQFSHKLQRLTAVAYSSAYSAEAAETVVQLCSVDDWSNNRKLPSGAAAACSVILTKPAEQQRNSVDPGQGSAEAHNATHSGPNNRILQQLVVSVLGDLDATSADPQLSNLLHQLPPSSMKLLLASDDLAVTSEDTVWITAQQYIDAHLALKAAKHNRQVWDLEPAYVAALYDDLYGLVRLPHVTDFCLSSVVSVLDQVTEASGREDFELLAGHVSKLCELRTLDGFVPAYKLQELVADGAPDSWLLPSRTNTLLAEGSAVACHREL